jgi:hypothetical protein
MRIEANTPQAPISTSLASFSAPADCHHTHVTCPPRRFFHLQLVPFPDPAFRNFVLILLGGDIGLSFLWDRLMTFIFAPQVLWASVKVHTPVLPDSGDRPLGRSFASRRSV